MGHLQNDKKTPSQTMFILNIDMERGQGVKQKIPDVIEGKETPNIPKLKSTN